MTKKLCLPREYLRVYDCPGTELSSFSNRTRHKVRANTAESSLIQLDRVSQICKVSSQLDFFFLQLLAQRIAFEVHKQRRLRISQP